MYNALLISLIIVSVIIILLVVMQPSKSNAASSLTGGGADSPQGKTKARGFEAFLIKTTVFFAVIFFILAITLAFFAN